MKSFMLCIAAVLVHAAVIHADVFDYIYQSGTDVVSSYSGTIDLTDLTPAGSNTIFSFIDPASAEEVFTSGAFSIYESISGPTSFGSGAQANASSSTGDTFAFDGLFDQIAVPVGYVSGTFISGSNTWDGTNLATLGLTDGTYTYTWGTGSHADSLVVEIGVAPPSSVPEPGSISLLLLVIIALAGLSRTSAFGQGQSSSRWNK
jgi:hypothetical protein